MLEKSKFSVTFQENYDMNNIEHKRVIIPLSLGPSYHKGERLEAFINFLNKFSPISIEFILADELQFHNEIIYDSTKNGENARDKSKKNGDKWMENNEKFLDNIQVKKIFSRWNKFINTDRYEQYLKMINNLYEDSSVKFQKAVHNSINSFVGKHVGRLSNNDKKQYVTKNCVNLILEECAVCLGWMINGNYDTIIYPNKPNPAIEWLLIHAGKYFNNIPFKKVPEYIAVEIQKNKDTYSREKCNFLVNKIMKTENELSKTKQELNDTKNTIAILSEKLDRIEKRQQHIDNISQDNKKDHESIYTTTISSMFCCLFKSCSVPAIKSCCDKYTYSDKDSKHLEFK